MRGSIRHLPHSTPSALVGLALLAAFALPAPSASAQAMVGRVGPNVVLPQGGMYGVRPSTQLCVPRKGTPPQAVPPKAVPPKTVPPKDGAKK